MRILQINSVINYGSTGKIVEQVSEAALEKGWDCIVAHGVKFQQKTANKEIIIGNSIDLVAHELMSFLFDRHGLASKRATRQLIESTNIFAPDIIHLHNIHNYYLNYPLLFQYLSSLSIPIVWTLHDCWPFTGHCSYFSRIGCEKWKSGCGRCPGLKVYPRSIVDNSAYNYREKEKWFTKICERLTIVPVSFWLEGFVRQSFLRDASFCTIHNGIDIRTFSPKEVGWLRDSLCVGNKHIVLGVALPWSPRKGLSDMYQLAERLPEQKYQVIVVGLSDEQLRTCPKNVIGIKRTNSAVELAEYYSLASVFVNPTYEDNYPTTNLEAMACGTPVVTYRTGGSPESVTDKTGWVVEQGDISTVESLIEQLVMDKEINVLARRECCRKRAEEEFDKDKCFEKYINLYENLAL